VRAEVHAAVAQIDIAWFEPDKNLAKVREFMDRVAERGGADIVLFPELANSGYVQGRSKDFAREYLKIAEKLDGPFMQGVAECARRHKSYIVTGLLQAHPDIPATVYNSSVMVSPEGEIVGVHHKMHIPGEERHYFYAGNTLTVVPTELGNVGLVVCADRRFPELSRMLALKGAEMITCVANIPSADRTRQDPERAYAVGRTRALENEVFWVECNRVGTEGDHEFSGHSCIAGPSGELLAKSETTEEDLIMAPLCGEELFNVRGMVPNFRDRRPERYGPLVELA
jgi:omega-amidase